MCVLVSVAVGSSVLVSVGGNNVGVPDGVGSTEFVGELVGVTVGSIVLVLVLVLSKVGVLETVGVGVFSKVGVEELVGLGSTVDEAVGVAEFSKVGVAFTTTTVGVSDGTKTKVGVAEFVAVDVLSGELVDVTVFGTAVFVLLGEGVNVYGICVGYSVAVG